MIKNKIKSFTLLFFIVSVSLFVSGCAGLETGKDMMSGVSNFFMGGEDNVDPPAELTEYEPEIKIEVVWDENGWCR